MKKNKFLALVLSAGVVFSLAACGDTTDVPGPGDVTETWTDQQIADAAMNSAAALTTNSAAPVRDSTNYGDSFVNELQSMSGGYLIAADSYKVVSDVSLEYTVSLSWEFDTTLFASTKDGANERLMPIWDAIDDGTSKVTVVKGTATYNGTTSSLSYNITLTDNVKVSAIEDMPTSGMVAVRGYVTSKIMGTNDSPYGIYVQSGDYGFMIYQPKAADYNKYKIGGCVQVNGTSSPHNGTRQITGGTCVITPLSGTLAEEVAKPNIVELGDAGLISEDTYGAMSKMSGIKITAAYDVPNIFDGKTTEHGYVYAEGLYKGKKVILYTDRYNGDADAKLEFYNKLKEAADSNGAKTITMIGAQAKAKTAKVEGEGENQETVDSTSNTPALLLAEGGEVTVSDTAYVETAAVDVTLSADVFVGTTSVATAKMEGQDAAEFNWSSSNESIFTVDDKGNVTGVSEGRAILTATLKTDENVKGSIRIHVVKSEDELPYAPNTSVSTVLEVENNTKTAYLVTGKVKELGNGKDAGTTGVLGDYGAYGNLTLVDTTDESKSILVYGLSGAYSALTYDKGTAEYSFTNAKDANTNESVKNIKVGDTITILAIRADFKETKELTGVLVNNNSERRVADEIAISDIANAEPTNSKGTKVLEVTGTISGYYGETATNFGDYGNFYLADEEGNKILVYGATASSGAIKWDADETTYYFSNPKDFATNEVTKGLKIGDKVTLDVITDIFNGTVQVKGENLRLADESGDVEEPVETLLSLDFTAENVLGNKDSYKGSETVEYSDGNVYLSNGCYNAGKGWVSLCVGANKADNFVGLVKDEVAKAIDNTVTEDTNKVTYNGETAYIASVDFNFDVANNKGFQFKVIDGKNFNDKGNFVKAFILESTDNSETWKIAKEIDGTSNTVTYTKSEASKIRYSIVYMVSSAQGRLPIGQVNWLA